MILALNLTNENPLLQLFTKIDNLLQGFEPHNHQHANRRGRPQLFSDVQIMKCLVYQAFHRIVSFRELEWRLHHDPIAKALIKIEKSPDHTTLFIRAKQLETTVYEPLYQIAIDFLHPDIRLCFWDSTALRASRYDHEAKRGKGTRLGWYVGYKLHAIISKDRIPLTWDMTTANIYDSQTAYLLDEVRQLNIFMILADGAYDSTKLLEKADSFNIHLVASVNKRKSKQLSFDNIKHPLRRKNFAFLQGAFGAQIMRSRVEAERFFSTLKVQYHLENPRLFGYRRYRRHVMWVLFSYLCDRLVDKTQGVQSAKAPWNR